MVVVADTTPLHYLVLIEHESVLPSLFGQVWVAPSVLRELSQPETPQRVREWCAATPAWLPVREPMQSLSSLPDALGPGERDSLALAVESAATLVLMDDRAGRREARRFGLFAAGTLRMLATAAERDLLVLREALARLRATTFRASDGLVQEILEATDRRE